MPKMICPDCGSDLVFVPENQEDIAYFEPFYLKEFMATVAKPKL